MNEPRTPYEQDVAINVAAYRRLDRCEARHLYPTYLPRCPWCPPIPKHKGA